MKMVRLRLSTALPTTSSSVGWHIVPQRSRAIAVAKLYFYYASMNAGKSTTLLQADFNYRERGLHTMLFTAAIDDRMGARVIGSRIGLEAIALPFEPTTDLFACVTAEHGCTPVACVLIDEAQFLTAGQVGQLARLADEANVPVLAYGLRTDFQGELFEGSARLLAIADALVELKSIKATMNLRIDGAGNPVRSGAQTEIGGNDRYVALCRRHFAEAMAG